MATKTEMVTFILDNSEEYTQAYLNSLSYKKIKSIYNETEELPENVDNLDLFAGDETNDEEDLDILKNVIEENEEVEEVWSYENLSPNDKRLYRRTGIKRISKSKRYSRFDKEEPKI